MQQKIEGLVLFRTPFKEKDLICRVLLRNGQKISVLFYGGRSARRGKAPLLELGMMNEIQLSQSKRNSDLYGAKETKRIWSHDLIRENYKAYYLLCFQLEVIDKVSVECNLHQNEDYENSEYEGIFTIMSNALFYLEKSLKDRKFKKFSLLGIFLVKILKEQGIYPQMNDCVITGKDLASEQSALIMINDQGGFAFKNAGLEQQEFSHQNDRTLYLFLKNAQSIPYSNFQQLDEYENQFCLQRLFQYFCFQMNFEVAKFKTYQVLS